MLHGSGVILEGRVEVRLAQVPRISRFGKEAEIRKHQMMNQVFLLVQSPLVANGLGQRIEDHHRCKQERQNAQGHEVDGRFTHSTRSVELFEDARCDFLEPEDPLALVIFQKFPGPGLVRYRDELFSHGPVYIAPDDEPG